MRAGEIMTLLRVRGYEFNRALGQHFLCDEGIVDEIVRQAAPQGRAVLEIGPGAGVMTCALADVASRVLAIELDRSLLPVLDTVLGRRDNVVVVRGDVMQQDLRALTRAHFGDKPFDVVSNLPYSITTAVLMKLLAGDLPLHCATVMVQSEAAARIQAQSGKEYGPLSILVQYRARVERVLEVPRGCFYPQPNVDSAVLRLAMEGPQVPAQDEGHLFRLVRAAFTMRRKTLANNLKGYALPAGALADLLAQCGIDGRARAEQVSVGQYVALSNSMLQLGKMT